jgi:hypothetical protein
MNYLTEIKLFYDWLETHPLTPAAISLWHGLMFIANRMGWEEEFTIPLSVLEVRTGMSAATLYRIRLQLRDAGLIEVESQGGRACAKYRIFPFESRFAFQNDRQNESQMRDKSEVNGDDGGFASQNEKQSASINKTKQDVNVHQKKQEKKKKVSEIDEWVNTLESPWRELMLLWLEYKKARKDAYTAVSGVKMCLTKLKNMSGSDPRVAQEIIERSMANNWAGLFPLSGQSSRGHPVDVPARGQRIGQILQPETEEHRNEILERFRAGIKTGNDKPKQ